MRNRLLIALLFAAFAIAARLPFLFAGKIPFDSDEAVEGLMALHVLEGALPAFFWGQAFKGIPEVYAAAAGFSLFGPGVAVLKSVTLLIFAAYVALNFALLDKTAARSVAIGASLLLIFSPPAFVHWSLSASAEYMWIVLLGTLLLLLRWHVENERAESKEQQAKGSLLLVGFVTGFGLWVHQLFAIYLLPLLLILSLRHEIWRHSVFRRPSRIAIGMCAIGAVYLALGLIAFFGSGIRLSIGPLVVSATAPQKMLRIAAAIAVIAVAVQVASRTTREQARRAATRYWPLAAGFVIGYLPVVLYSVFVEPARSPARVANLRQLLQAAPDMFGNIVPIIAGFKLPTAERLEIPAIAALPATTAIAAYLWSTRRRLGKDFFPTFVVLVPVLFLGAGVYLDTQSYRYLIPWYAGLAVAWAAGSRVLSANVPFSPQAKRAVYVVILVFIAGVHARQQWLWYQKLTPDTQSLTTIECLERKGIRGGFAEYWTSYKLTFLSRERIIFAPTDGVDRYPRYTEFVTSLPAHEKVRLKPDTTYCE